MKTDKSANVQTSGPEGRALAARKRFARLVWGQEWTEAECLDEMERDALRMLTIDQLIAA